ncbi:hypothetical protein B0A52_01920 [Exophiala mesophila]|uniref:Translation initiation factor eIF2B subunit delta n=1 Tax=Exophiala mesophila TaxID=212818 RepID=A0A438NEE4_EXOME|nr:hypothetical protein B0A52_01920 [Exophiala mesophila]
MTSSQSTPQSTSNASSNSLNPSAPTFTPSDSTTGNGHPQEIDFANPAINGAVTNVGDKKVKPARPDPAARSTTADDIAEAGAGVKLTGAQLKKQKAAEKAARRAEKVAAKGAVAQAEAQVKPESQRRSSTTKREGESLSAGAHHKRTLSSVGKALPVRGGAHQPGSQATTQSNSSTTAAGPEREKHKEVKKVPMFSHLYPKEKRATLSGAGREIHPAILSLGLQIRDYVICGGNARCVATLLAFKKVIQAYTTPSGVALSRHLLTHLNHQIAYLRNARPLSMSQGNAIRWLKNLVSTQPVDLTDSEAKQDLCQAIDIFIRERITLADEVIAREATARINDRDVILTYAKSSIVEKALLTAHEQGKDFKVIVVDSRPMFEGKNLARRLVRAGLRVQYALLSAVADIVDFESVTKCFLGASSMLGNGSLFSRAGSAVVAMMAKESSKNKARNVPVIVLCETVKFSAKAALDSVIMNEIGDPDALVETVQPDTISYFGPPPTTASTGGKGGAKKQGNREKDEDDADEKASSGKGLESWKEQQGLFLLNLMYDVTPPQFLDLVICELGSLPPQAVPVVNGAQGDDAALA